MPADKEERFLGSEASDLTEVSDFSISTESEVFVPGVSGLVYGDVAGQGVASGRTQILVPAKIPGSSASSGDFMSHYVTKRNHFAYSCFC